MPQSPSIVVREEFKIFAEAESNVAALNINKTSTSVRTPVYTIRECDRMKVMMYILEKLLKIEIFHMSIKREEESPLSDTDALVFDYLVALITCTHTF